MAHRIPVTRLAELQHGAWHQTPMRTSRTRFDHLVRFLGCLKLPVGDSAWIAALNEARQNADASREEVGAPHAGGNVPTAASMIAVCEGKPV